MASIEITDQQSVPSLKLAFCLFKYFPHGGLQRDFLKMALECQRRGHDIRVYTLTWRGRIPEDFDVTIVPVTALTNHTKYERFSQWVQKALARNPVDGVIGINKMPGLDVYFAADSCYEEKAQSQRNWIYRQLPRYRHFARYEQSVFSNDSKTEIMMISETQQVYFEKHYNTRQDRMHFLPPGIDRDRIAPADVEEIRQDMRARLGLTDDDFMLLTVGSGFIKKGLKRALFAVRSLPRKVRKRTRYFVIGEDNPAPFKRLILMLGIHRNVTILSGRDDVPQFLFAADVCLHPALDENAGIVLLEAAVAGLPVLATDNCGYGHYIAEANMGRLVPSPFEQTRLNTMLLEMMQCSRSSEWRVNGRRFSRNENIYKLPREASGFIEQVVLQRYIEAGRSVDKGKLAFAMFKYFPFGGLQRDFLHIALECQRRGYNIRVYTLSWEGEIPPGFDVVIVPVNAITNHTRYQKFHDWVQQHLAECPVDSFIGFNKMPGLDIYYAADSCYEEKARHQRHRTYRLIPRYKHFSKFEKAVFQVTAGTEILLISEVQKPLFMKYYDTPGSRFHLLPPGVSQDRRVPPDAAKIRRDLRREFNIGDDEIFLLMVGSGFKTKGLDRILLGLASLPTPIRLKTQFIAIGEDRATSFLRLVHRYNLDDQVRIFKGRDDIPRFLQGADLLVHPALNENAGIILLEAIISGLPVLATDVCGYAHYIEEADAGRLVSSPYEQKKFDQLLLEMITSLHLHHWQQNGLDFAEHADIYSMPGRAADYICGSVSSSEPSSEPSSVSKGRLHAIH